MRGLLAALWAGQLLTVALLAAPNAFATLARPEAGLYVSGLLRLDALVSLSMGLLLLMLEQRLQRDAHPGRLSFSAGLVLPALALLLTLLGQEVLQPLVAAAKAGQGNFALLHGLSLTAFAAKTGAVLTLAWKVR